MISINENSPVPVFEQIRSQLSSQILLGTLKAEQRLPSVRQLAHDLGLAPGTVARAYSSLEGDGMVSSRRGAGTRVRVQAEYFPKVLDAALEFVKIARASSLDLERAHAAVIAAWAVDE